MYGDARCITTICTTCGEEQRNYFNVAEVDMFKKRSQDSLRVLSQSLPFISKASRHSAPDAGNLPAPTPAVLSVQKRLKPLKFLHKVTHQSSLLSSSPPPFVAFPSTAHNLLSATVSVAA